MRRFFLLWLMLLAIEICVAAVSFASLHSIDARFEPFLTTLLAPAVQAALLLRVFPRLRDPEFVTPAAALRSRTVASAATVLLGLCAMLVALAVGRVVPARAFDVLRGVICLSGAIAFSVAGVRRVHGAVASAVILWFLTITTGSAEWIASHLFPSQPIAFRWLVYGVVSTTMVVAIFFHAVGALRQSSPYAATLLEWSLAPAMLAAIIVGSNFFWRPYLTPASSLAANAAGLAAAGLACLASIASLQRSA